VTVLVTVGTDWAEEGTEQLDPVGRPHTDCYRSDGHTNRNVRLSRELCVVEFRLDIALFCCY